MKPRLISMLLTGFALALGLLLAVQISQSIRSQNNNETGVSAATEVSPDPNATIDPVIFKTISEQGNQLRLSGTGEAGVVISIENQGRQLAEVTADDAGNWNAVVPMNPEERMIIDLVVYLEAGAKIRSDEKLYRIPPPEMVADEGMPPPPALLMMTAPGGPTRIIQSPFRGLPTDGGLSLGPIDYDQSGGVIFSGMSEVEGRVRIYANDTVIGERRVSTNGRWFFIAAETLPYGSYDIRVELITTEDIVATVTLPFERQRAGSDEAALSVSYEPFKWQIRRKLYGGGHQYTVVFAPQESEPIVPSE